MIKTLRTPAVIIIIFTFLQLTAQNTGNDRTFVIMGDTVNITPLKETEIAPETEKINIKLNKITGNLITQEELDRIDSIIFEREEYFKEQKKIITKELDNLSRRKISDIKNSWEKYSLELKNLQKKLDEKTGNVGQDLKYVLITEKELEVTKKTNQAGNASSETLKWLTEEIKNLKNTEKKLNKVKNRVFLLTNRLSALIVNVEDLLNKLDERQLKLTFQFFQQNAPPIWVSPEPVHLDSTGVSKIRNDFKDNKATIKNYFGNNIGVDILFLLLLTALSLFFFFGYKKITSNKLSFEIDRAKGLDPVIFKHYISSSLVITTLVTLWITPYRPSVITQFLILLILVPSLILFVQKLNKKLLPFLFLFVFIFLINELQILLGISYFSSRLMLLFKTVVTLLLFIFIANPRGRIQKEFDGKMWRFAFRLAYVYAFLLIISVFANILGYTNLSVLLLVGTVKSLILAAIISIIINIFNSAFYLIYHSKATSSVNIIKNHFEIIEKRVKQIVLWYMIFVWAKATLASFELWEVVRNWLTGLMQSEWKIGSSVISIGGIITFFIVLVVTFTISKFVKLILKEEVFPRVTLPRGVPGAITMVTGYVIIAYGFYVALTSAGVDLHQFGLIAGALGVGIGFGLQNIVANFISGLVLAFERPIQVGDTIEVGNLLGDVVHIGVRASTIRTYDGADVVVPNSSLISNDVINWTLSDRRKRRTIKVNVAYGTDPHKVLDILYDVVGKHPKVLKNPGPWATFDGFGESSLNFSIRFWVTFDIGLTVKSQIAMDIYDALAENGITIPFPQQDIHIKSFDPTVQTTIYPWDSIKNDSAVNGKSSRKTRKTNEDGTEKQ